MEIGIVVHCTNTPRIFGPIPELILAQRLKAQPLDYHYYAIVLRGPCSYANDTIISVFTYSRLVQ